MSTQALSARHRGDEEAAGLLRTSEDARDSIDSLSNRDPEEGDDSDADGDVALKADAPGWFVTKLTVSAGISGLLFGYDTGIISATLVMVYFDLSNRALTPLDKSLITSATALFALLLSPFTSTLADTHGRRRIILIADCLFIIGALIQALCTTVPVMIFGRCIVGAAVGAASFVVPLYISEIAPTRHRGRLVTANVLFITGGQVLAYIVGWALTEYGDHAYAWRWMVGLGAIPAILQLVLVLSMPETPRWLVQKGDLATARTVISNVHGCLPAGADPLIRSIQLEVRTEQEASAIVQARRAERGGEKWFLRWLPDTWMELFGSGRNRRALVIACLLQGLQQLSGFNSLMYFSATIFTMVGFDQPTLTSLTVAGTNMAFTGLALVLIDRIGRRRILLSSIPLMAIGLLVSAYGFSHLQLLSKGNPGVLILISFMLYVAGYAIGIGNVPWMQSELFPLSVRSAGSGIATGVNWGANFVVGLTFLLMMDTIGAPATFVGYAVICMLGWITIYFIYPETAGLSLEETASLLETGWGVSR